MNILYVNTYYTGGGAEKMMRYLYKNMSGDNIKSLCIVGRGSVETIDDVPVIYYKFGEKVITTFIGIALKNTLLKTNKAKRRIIEYIEQNDIDIVHFHNLHGNYLGLEDIAEIKKKCKNVIITLHDMWAFTGICTHAIECKEWYLSECKRCQGNLMTKSCWFSKNLLCHKKETLACKGITFVTPSRWLYKMTQLSYLSKEKVITINNGIDLNKFTLHDQTEVRKKYGISVQKNIILFLANGITNVFKGYSFLVDALEMILNKSDYELLIVGNKENEKINLDYKTHSMGFIESEEILSELYSAADIFILPSVADVYPYTPMESIASGTPVVAFDIGGIPEIVSEEVGWIVSQQNAKALAECIRSIFDEQKLLQRKSMCCRRYAEERFSIDIMIEQYRKLYESILNNSN